MDELMAMYNALPATEREALDETIMNQGINDLKSLLYTLRMVETYFQEQ